MSSITIDEVEIRRMANDPHGPIAIELEFVVANTVEWIVRDTLSIPAPFAVNQRGWKLYEPNPPVGPPRQRSGLLWHSVNHSRPAVDAHGLHCDVTGETNAAYDYLGQQLVPRGYIFVELGDARFTLVPRQADQ